MTTGWTFTQGSIGEEVAAGVTIYSSKSCLSIVRAGGSTPSDNNINLDVSDPEDFGEEVIQKSAEDEAYEAALEKYTRERALEQSNFNGWDQEGFNFQLECMAFVRKTYKTCAKQYGEGTPECKQKYEEILSTDEKYQKNLKRMTSAYSLASESEEKLKKMDEDFKKQWGAKARTQVSTMGTPSSISTPAASSGAITSKEPPIIEAQKEQDAALDELVSKVDNIDISGPTSGLVAWLDAVEEYIDSMPQFKEDSSPLYEVEKQGVRWVYTGATAVADPEFNKKIREFKKEQCKKLNNLIEVATKKIEDKLNDLSKKLAPIMPLIEAIKIIQGGVSIDTLVKWGKGVINFCTSIYQMFYNTYKSVMELMELVVIRFPQIISKMMDKITELDCPVEMKSIHVDVKGNIAQANKEKEAKKKKGQ